MELIQKNIVTAEQKLDWWGEGPWGSEPDLVDFEHHGFRCKIQRKIFHAKDGTFFGGYLCGYVHIPPDHPWSKFTDDTLEFPADAHGGITFNACSLFEGHWIGFDCAHSHDVNPSMRDFYEELNGEKIEEYVEDVSIFKPIYRTVLFCIEECRSLAEQAKNAILNENSADP